MDDDATVLVQTGNNERQWVHYEEKHSTRSTYKSTIPSRCLPARSVIFHQVMSGMNIVDGQNRRDPPRPARRSFALTVVFAIEVCKSRSKLPIKRSNARLFR
jgi:hypothetical protein